MKFTISSATLMAMSAYTRWSCGVYGALSAGTRRKAEERTAAAQS